MNIKEQILEWQKNDFVKTLEQMGIGTGAKVVDFGCAVGNYTFSAAYAIGDEGSVYAIDCNLRALESIKSESEQRQIENIVPLRIEKNNKIPLDTASVDMVMIYDLIHDLGNQKTQILLVQFTALGGRHSVLERPLSDGNGRLFLCCGCLLTAY